MTLTQWWDDKTIDCPNQQDLGTCRINKNELCLFMQASGACPAVMPPWGAWRSILGAAIALAAEVDEIWAGILARERGED